MFSSDGAEFTENCLLIMFRYDFRNLDLQNIEVMRKKALFLGDISIWFDNNNIIDF